MSLEGNPLIENSIEIEEVDNSKHDYYFEVKIDGGWNRMNIEDF
jgi:hypothetical protein